MPILSRVATWATPFIVSALLTACAAPQPSVDPRETSTAPSTLPGYEAMDDGGFHIPAVEERHLIGTVPREEVAYDGPERPGSVVVDTHARRLYYVLPDGRAIRYAIAVGREGLSFRGSGYIGRKEHWPAWTPTANMVRTRPDLYAAYAGGLPGGLSNPLGARAMYLYRGGKDTMFRIHGTIENNSIGRSTSAGCIRLFNQDAIDLYDRVKMGAFVKVRSAEESLRIEGPYMDDAYGRAVPETPENIAKKEADLVLIAEQEARKAEEERQAAEAAAEAERRRLAACARKGIAEADCPPLPEPEQQASVRQTGHAKG